MPSVSFVGATSCQQQALAVEQADSNFTALVTFRAAENAETYTVWTGQGYHTSSRLYVANGTAVLSVNGEVSASGGGLVAPGSVVSLGVVCSSPRSCAVLEFG